jgi:hypothetical protein
MGSGAGVAGNFLDQSSTGDEETKPGIVPMPNPAFA